MWYASCPPQWLFGEGIFGEIGQATKCAFFDLYHFGVSLRLWGRGFRGNAREWGVGSLGAHSPKDIELATADKILGQHTP